MPPKSFAAIAAQLLAAPDVPAALTIVNDQLASEKYAGLALLSFDGRRNMLFGPRSDGDLGSAGGSVWRTPLPGVTVPSAAKRGEGPTSTEPPHMAFDHLPVHVRQAVLAGERFADVGEQAVQYARLLGISPPADDVRLFLKGVVLDRAIAAVLAVYQGGRWGGARLAERVEPLAALFELAYARFFEREARFEAVSALHNVTTRLRAEHAGGIAELERELTRLRDARGDVIDRGRAEALQQAAERAEQRAVAAEQRLAAVEEQVTNAVQRLEQAHLQIHRQSEELRTQRETLRQLGGGSEARAGRSAPHPQNENAGGSC